MTGDTIRGSLAAGISGARDVVKAKLDRAWRRSRGKLTIRRREFKYQPINSERKEFRILVVHPCSSGTPIPHCSVEHASLLDKPEYEAISYCWGDANLRTHIRLNGSLVDVPASSASAIRRMRLPDRDRRIWIDAVCINQDDLEERSQQVAMMGDIYGNTKRTLVWLSEDEYETAWRTIKHLQEIVGKIRRRANNFAAADFDALFAEEGIQPMDARNTLNVDLDRELLSNSFDRPWQVLMFLWFKGRGEVSQYSPDR
jgi:hypothetical protein